MWKANVPDDIAGMDLTEGYENLPTDAGYFEGKSVLILGELSVDINITRIFSHDDICKLVSFLFGLIPVKAMATRPSRQRTPFTATPVLFTLLADPG